MHRAERADRLVDALAGVLAEPLDDALEAEIVAVPTRGVERWLAQRLSATLGAAPGAHDGVCANVAFPSPWRLLAGAVATASKVGPDEDPWLPERAVWPLLDAVDDALGEPWLGALAAHVGGAAGAGDDAAAQRRTRRFAAVRHLADLYQRYAVQRPAMVRAWASGDDVDGHGRPLPPDGAWQAELWRRLRARVGTASPAERLVVACAVLRADRDAVDLPRRIAVVGLTRLPPSHLDVLVALSALRDVHLLLLHPSPALWTTISDVAVGASPPARDDDPTAAATCNALLASWGRDARELQVVLRAAGADMPGTATAGGVEVAVVHHARPHDGPPTTLLQRLQADVRDDRPSAGSAAPSGTVELPLLDPGDRSVQVHSCHGRARQVEVVRDAILHLLEDSTDDEHPLEPRDVVVMCPDIDAFAPLITAAFGAVGEVDDDDAATVDEMPDLRVRLADRSLRQTNPVLGVVAEILALASARVTASQVVDLAGREPVRRRFRLDDDDLARVEDWVAASGVRWGLDAAHRAPYQLDGVPGGTWRAGLDRLLLGVARSEDDLDLFADVLPLDDVDSGDIDLAGRLAELVDRLHGALLALVGPQPVAAWMDALADAADALTAAEGSDAWQVAELRRVLAEVVDEASAGVAAGAPGGVALELGEVQALLAERLRGQPTRAGFRTGHLTMCTLHPMRSVPHRVVCVMGLDDEVFPRKTAPDGDDLLLADPAVGDHDPRSEDRQLLLDALMAAGDHLVLTYGGRNERTNAVRPPAVPVGEVLDAIDRTVRTDARDDAGNPLRPRDLVVVQHPLQPFSARCFARGELVSGRRWSFDAVSLDGARAAARDRLPPPTFLPAPLDPPGRDVVELDDLVRFLAHPVRAFLRQRLGVSVGDRGDELSDALPVELDGLQEWDVGERLLAARLLGVDASACRAAEVARGALPPGALGEPLIRRVGPAVDELAAAAADAATSGDAPGSLDVQLELADGRLLVGTVPDVVGDVLRPVTYSRLGPRHRLTSWARLLALTAARPERPFAATTIGRGRRREPVARVLLAPLGADGSTRRVAALRHLAVLVDLHDRGLREPLPIACRTSAAYAEARWRGDADPLDAARDEWQSGWSFPKEDRDLEHQLVRGRVLAFEDLLAEAPRRDEAGEGWPADERSRFGRYACRLWGGLLAHERTSRR